MAQPRALSKVSAPTQPGPPCQGLGPLSFNSFVFQRGNATFNKVKMKTLEPQGWHVVGYLHLRKGDFLPRPPYCAAGGLPVELNPDPEVGPSELLLSPALCTPAPPGLERAGILLAQCLPEGAMCVSLGAFQGSLPHSHQEHWG